MDTMLVKEWVTRIAELINEAKLIYKENQKLNSLKVKTFIYNSKLLLETIYLSLYPAQDFEKRWEEMFDYDPYKF